MQKTLLFAFAIVAAQFTALAPTHAQPELPDLFNQSGPDGGGQPEFNYSLQANQLEAGGHAVLTVEVLLPAERHTYSMQDENSTTKVKFDEITGLSPVSDFIPDRDPVIKVDKILGWVSQKYYGSATWTRHYRITDPADAKLSGTISGTFCSESPDGGGSCLPFDDTFALNIAITTDKLPQAPAAEATVTHPYATEIAPTLRNGKPSPVKFQFGLTPENAAAGEEVTLTVGMQLDKGWHTFSLDQDPEALGGTPSSIDVTTIGLDPVDEKFTPDHEPHAETLGESTLLQFEDHVTWTRKFRVQDDVTVGNYGADGSVSYQVCKTSCQPPTSVEFELGAEIDEVETPSHSMPSRSSKGSPKETIDEPPAIAAATADSDTPEQLAEMAALYTAETPINFDTLGGAVESTLLTAIVGAFIGGILLNLMPCVFPVLGLKVMGFVQLAGNDADKIRRHGLAFTAGLVVSMWCLAAVILTLRESAPVNWGQQMGNSYFVGAMIILLFVLGLNMAGIFEMGTSLTRLGGSVTQKKGYSQSFFSGILTTLIATPCSGPFLGAAMGYTLAQTAPIAMFLFTIFGLGIAMPYLLLSFFPKLIDKLPRPGAWMETFKVTMAFALFATSAFFMKTYGAQTGVNGMSWMVMALVVIGLAFYLYGHYSLPHLKAGTRFWKGAVLPLLIVGVGGWMAYDSAGLKGGISSHSAGGLAWQNWQPGKVEFQTQKKKRIVWVDYTADW